MLLKLYKKAIIVGCGPAGLSAAIYLKRALIDFIILGNFNNSQLSKCGQLDNYLGYFNTNGIYLLNQFKNHLNYLDINVFDEMVTSISLFQNKFTLYTNNNIFISDSIIYAAGASYKKLNIIGEDNLMNKGLSYCVVCDGFLYKNKTVIVIGGGNSALDSALYLSKLNCKVIIINKNNNFKNKDEILWKKCMEYNIEIIYEANTLSINGDKKVESITYSKNNEIFNYLCDAVFINIGIIYNTNLLSEFNITNKYGEVIINSNNSTKINGLFAAGDVTSYDSHAVPKQLIVAAGEGAKAALTLIEYLNNLK